MTTHWKDRIGQEILSPRLSKPRRELTSQLFIEASGHKYYNKEYFRLHVSSLWTEMSGFFRGRIGGAGGECSTCRWSGRLPLGRTGGAVSPHTYPTLLAYDVGLTSSGVGFTFRFSKSHRAGETSGVQELRLNSFQPGILCRNRCEGIHIV